MKTKTHSSSVCGNKQQNVASYSSIMNMKKKEDVIEAGLNFLKRSKSSEEKTTNERAPHKHSYRTVRELEVMTLMVAVGKLYNSERIYENKGKGILVKSQPISQRRGAICEEQLLERKGLIKLLREYFRLKHLNEYSLL